MNRFASVFALLIVVFGVSVATSFSIGISLAVATALVAGAMLVHEVAFSTATAGRAAAQFSQIREFFANVTAHTIRFSIAALAIAWTVASLQWYVGS
jgi:hypothetical protein